MVLTIIGTVYIWILSTQRHCKCKLCRQEFIIDEAIAEGGFGAVYLVHKPVSKKQLFKSKIQHLASNKESAMIEAPQKFILKKLEMKDITELDQVQYEAKQLRRLNHKNIVNYEDEFMHIDESPMGNRYIYIIIMEYCTNGDLTDKVRAY